MRRTVRHRVTRNDRYKQRRRRQRDGSAQVAPFAISMKSARRRSVGLRPGIKPYLPLALMHMVTEVHRGGGVGLMLAVAGRTRPDKLEGYSKEQQRQQPTTHDGFVRFAEEESERG